jgi:hypothetical protein
VSSKIIIGLTLSEVPILITNAGIALQLDFLAIDFPRRGDFESAIEY